MADHLDDRRGRADDRLDRARADQDEEQGKRRLRLRPVEAQYVDAGEDQQAGERNDQGRRDPACEMIERRDQGAVDMGLGRGQGPEHILEGLADDQRHGRDLARDLEQARGRSAARAGQHQVQHHRRPVDQGAAGEVGWQQAQAGDDQVGHQQARQRRAQQQLQIVIAAEQADREQGGHGERAEMRRHQPERARAQSEEAEREQDPRDLLPEDAQPDLRPEGAAGAGGGGRDLDEGPRAAAPRRTGRPPGAGGPHPAGAAEKSEAIAAALKVTISAISEEGMSAISKASLTAPCAPSSPCVGTTRCSASGIEIWMTLVARFTAPHRTT